MLLTVTIGSYWGNALSHCFSSLFYLHSRLQWPFQSKGFNYPLCIDNSHIDISSSNLLPDSTLTYLVAYSSSPLGCLIDNFKIELLIFFPRQSPTLFRSFPHRSSWRLYPSSRSDQPLGFFLTWKLLGSPSKIWRRTSKYIQNLATSLYLPLYNPLPSSLALITVTASSLFSSFYPCSSVVCP